jgi:hypothetical protein
MKKKETPDKRNLTRMNEQADPRRLPQPSLNKSKNPKLVIRIMED